MTIQQIIGLGAVVSSAILGILIASPDVPKVILLVLSATTAGLNAANVYLSSTFQMAKALVRRHTLSVARTMLLSASNGGK